MVQKNIQKFASMCAICALLLMFAGVVSAALDVPSIQQVYQAAHAGHLGQAESMTHEVLRAYPNSARAHYVMAQILAAEGRNSEARNYLAQAERLKPGLPFANPQSVANLERRINTEGQSPTVTQSSTNHVHWWWLVVAAVVIFVLSRRLRNRRSAPTNYNDNAVGSGSTNTGPAPMTRYGGWGGGLLGSILAGLGFGAGAAAGERAMDRIFGGDRSNEPTQPEAQEPPSDPGNLGGDEFGMQSGDSSSGGWQDSGDQTGANSGDDFGGGDSSDGGWDDSSGGGGDVDV